MTLMEILVALSLLMIIIVGTTPVMLQAYNGLYKAGEYTQDTYEAKSEIEEKLATRNTRNIYPGFIVNFNNLGDVVEVNGRRAVSSLYGSLETLFTNGKVHVAIVSAKTVNDDYSANGFVPGVNGATITTAGWHEVVLQTTNLDFGTTNAAEAQSHISLNTNDVIQNGGLKVDAEGEVSDTSGTLKIIDISFIKPDKRATGTASVYTYKTGNLASVDYSNIKVNPLTGRITVRVNGFDFTQSPIQVLVAYLDENKNRQETKTYLFVDTPTIMAAGATGSYKYYTSPGVLTKKVKNTSGEFVETSEFGVFGRTMRIDETSAISTYTDPLHSSTVRIKTGTSAIKTGTIIKNITWVEDDITTPCVKPYYVMTGTNGAIYRTYSLTGANTDLNAMLNPKDNEFILDDRSSTVVYPALWGGDKAHQFGYSTYGKSMSYKYEDKSDNDADNGCWYTESGRNTGVGHASANVYGTSAEYSYYYNGWGQTYAYMSQKSRKISYILTEHGLSLRLGGYLKGEDPHHEKYNIMWENLNNIKNSDPYINSNLVIDSFKIPIIGTVIENWRRRDFYHPTYGDSSNQTGVVTAIWGDEEKDEYFSQDCPVYFNDQGATEGDMFADIYWGNIRIKYLSNMPLDYFHASARRGHWDGKPQDGQSSSVRFLNHRQWSNDGKTYDVYDPKITVTDAVYLPALGSMFYVGTVAADAYLQQNDNLANKDWVASYRLRPSDNHGAITTYLVRSNEDGTATEVHKYSYQSIDYGSYDFEWDHYTALVTNYYLAGKATMTEAKTSASGNAAEAFYVTRPNTTASKLFTDVSFTLGFSSNREFVYSEIAYGKVGNSIKEAYKGCEPYYFKSHYPNDGGTLHIPNAAIVNNDGNSTLYSQTADNLNKVYNDYYNVWFPGEMYNLTKVASKDGITVAVGYAVAGSSYQFVLGTKHENTSTALGGIFNDGVLACSIAGDSETTLSNLLYFKDNTSTSFDNSYLSNKDGYKTAFTSGYGTHSRDSIQFTAVDIGVQNVADKGKAVYYAYYADNKGRVFRSKVATIITSGNSETITKVNYISDTNYEPGAAVPDELTAGYMEQLKPTNMNFTDLYEKITTIKVYEDMIFISGKPSQKSLTGVPLVVGKINEETNAVTWTVVYEEITGASTGTHKNYWVEDMLVLEGYVYLAGRKSDDKGFVSALAIEPIEKEISDEEATCEFIPHFVEVPDALYAIAGHK